jgi:hypothetical protein
MNGPHIVVCTCGLGFVIATTGAVWSTDRCNSVIFRLAARVSRAMFCDEEPPVSSGDRVHGGACGAGKNCGDGKFLFLSVYWERTRERERDLVRRGAIKKG